ncbi:MAG: hypothetical protein J6Y82_07275 [Bacteroidales bacterium]|nr:hypothetical protein [Bacteroidales bacterium]
MNKKNVIIQNFFNVGVDGDIALYEEDLGWNESIIRDAQSDDPETIFRYIVEIVGLNILFYWTGDRNFYTIETERSPIEVRRIYDNPQWDGKREYMKADINGNGPHTCSAGQVLATFEEPTQIWNKLTINGVSIGDVLSRSAILDLD